IEMNFASFAFGAGIVAVGGVVVDGLVAGGLAAGGLVTWAIVPVTSKPLTAAVNIMVWSVWVFISTSGMREKGTGCLLHGGLPICLDNSRRGDVFRRFATISRGNFTDFQWVTWLSARCC